MAQISEKRLDGWAEVASALALSTAAMLTSWAGYQAAMWDGEQAANYSRANALRIKASRDALSASTKSAAEVDMFEHWLDAKGSGDARLAKFYQQRFPDDFKAAFNAWMRERPLTNPSAPRTPYDMKEFQQPGLIRADQLDAQAEATFAAGQRANQISDAFTQATTILATALFFGGIGQTFKTRFARLGLLAVAVLAIILALVRLVGLPLLVLGFGPPTGG